MSKRNNKGRPLLKILKKLQNLMFIKTQLSLQSLGEYRQSKQT
jgi:hypothetical protein